MLTWIAPLVIAAQWVVAADPAFTPGQQLLYRGTVTQKATETGQTNLQQKSFDLTWYVASADATGSKLYWIVDERGRGAWPWPDRFGQVTLDAAGNAQGDARASVRFDHGEGDSPVPLPAPTTVLAKQPALEATWTTNGQAFTVQADKQVADRATWQVQVANNYGVKRTLFVDKSTPLLIALNERVFMNKGTEYTLEMTLADVTTTDVRPIAATFDSLIALRDKLERAPSATDAPWNAEQIERLAAELPEIEKKAAGGPLERLVASAARDAKLQSGRADEIAQLKERLVGQPLPEINLPGLAGGTLSNADLAGQVTVLHFWEYRDQPLNEPYGQVGYLEYLHQKQKAKGLKVYGIAVDGRLSEDDGRRAVASSVRKLKSFMNLTYPLALDAGPAIKAVGDPRILGATLPLFVVVGRDGQVKHAHVGYYEVDRQQGLKELDAAVTGALKE